MLKVALKLGGAAALLWYLSQSKDSGGNVLLSSNVVKNGQCFRVDLLATGGSRNVPVSMSECTSDAGAGDLGNVADDPNAGFYGLVHLFDNEV